MKTFQIIAAIIGLGLVLNLALPSFSQPDVSCDDDEDLPDPPECPDEEDEDSIYFPVPYDCRKFFQCTNGMAKCFRCPPLTVWNQTERVCIHETQTECVIVTTTPRIPTTDLPTDPPITEPPTTEPPTTTEPTTTEPTTTEPTTTEEPTTTTTPTTTTPTTTTPTTTTPEPTTTTEEPTTAPPTDPPVPTTTASTTTTRAPNLCPIDDPMPPPDDECPAWEPYPTYHPYPYDCRKYFQCSNGLAICHICANGTVWSQNDEVCAFEADVGCVIVTTTASPFVKSEHSIVDFFKKFLPF